jgi:hypothetical protein
MESVTAAGLIARLRSSPGTTCSRCQSLVCYHALLMNWYLGFKGPGACLSCVAAALGFPLAQLRERLIGAIVTRDCYAEAWEWASRHEALAGPPVPGCPAPTPESGGPGHLSVSSAKT